MSDPVVRVRNVRKKFCRSLQLGMLYTAADISRDLVGLDPKSVELRRGEFWAVDEVSFDLHPGECLGLVGANGAGKSTLLKLLNGIILPDAGSISITGRVGALIEVGAGFHPMLSGRENIYVNGSILGMSKREIDAKYDEIVEFSGLNADILEAPVKTYSSGMYVRLGFAVAVHTEPDVLLIDEVLAVGDIRFIGRCREKVAQLRARGVCMILVSHNLALLEDSCDRGLLMARGKCIASGTIRAATAAYRSHIRAIQEESSGNGRPAVVFVSGRLLAANGEPIDTVTCGEAATLELGIAQSGRVTSGYLSIWAVSEDDQQVTGVGYLAVGRDIDAFDLDDGCIRIDLRCQMMPGRHQLGVTFSTDGQFQLTDEFVACTFTVLPWNDVPCKPSGIFRLDVRSKRLSNNQAPCLGAIASGKLNDPGREN